jgi:lipoprotein-anchoring transpeptidase ErfK/SrfK
VVAFLLAVLLAPSAVAQDLPAPPAPPAIAQAASGPQTITLYYQPGEGATGAEYSLDNGPWTTCAQELGTCTVTGLMDGRTYRITLRSANSSGVSAPAGPASAVPSAPPGVDPDKPTQVFGKVRRVSAEFEAAGNDLGVSGSRTRLGVGTLPEFVFYAPISNKAVVERHLVVTATDGTGVTAVVPGAWGWLGDRRVVFRPKAYWPGTSMITITSTLGGVLLGRDGGAALIGSPALDVAHTFGTSRAFVALVDGSTKTMRVWIDGELVKNFRVSLGGPAWETRNGVKVTSLAKEKHKVYRSTSLGITDPAEAYVLPAPWNTRLTPTGEYIHAAPWAYGRLGRYNGSHGCTNMFEQDAKWIFDTTIPGDIVMYRNTGGPAVEPWNGPGGLWNIPWRNWVKKSALGKPTQVVDDANVDVTPPNTTPQASA